MPEAIRDTTVMMHLVFRSRASSFQTSPKSTSSLRWAKVGAKSPSCIRPAVCVIFLLMLLSPYRLIYFRSCWGSASSDTKRSTCMCRSYFSRRAAIRAIMGEAW